MKYDKDIRACRILMTIIGLLMFTGFVIDLMRSYWLFASAFALWTYACYVTREVMDIAQKNRDTLRLITAARDGRDAQ